MNGVRGHHQQDALLEFLVSSARIISDLLSLDGHLLRELRITGLRDLVRDISPTAETILLEIGRQLCRATVLNNRQASEGGQVEAA